MEDNLFIVKYVKDALDLLYKKDEHLIIYPAQPDNTRKNQKWYHVGERAIVFRFGLYFYELLQKDDRFKQLNLDCEYNRNGNQPKKLKSFKNGTYPDIILHKRGSNDFNRAVIEFKGHWNNDYLSDFEKLKEFTKQRSVYNFDLGLFILLAKQREDVKITYFVDGEKTDDFLER